MGAGLISFIPLIVKGIGDTISLIAGSGSPNYPGAPKLAKLPVQKARQQMEDYEAQRMQASIDAWKQKFPDLYKGGQYMVNDIAKQQQGYLGGNIAADMASSGLGPVHEGGDQYRLSQDIGLSPITLSQRTSQAVTRQMAQNPEWTNKISGGTLATMIANNYRNQNSFSQFLGAQQTAMYAQGQAQGAYNTQALLSGLTGGAALASQIHGANQYGPLSPTGQGLYQGISSQQQAPPVAGGYGGGYGASYSVNQPYGGYPGASAWYGNTPSYPMGQSWGNMMQSPYGTGQYQYSNFWDPNQVNISGPPTGSNVMGNYGI